MEKRLSGKIALITGGSSGIGLASAKKFIEEGAQVIITARNQQDLDAASKSLGPSLTAIAADVSKLEDLDRVYAVIKEKFGRLDILFANAGIGTPGTIGSISEKDFDKLFDINVKGLFFTVQKALPLLQDGSSIILTSSVAARKGGLEFSAYSGTKAAVCSFARCWANDLNDRKIRVNSLSPGPTKTPIFDKMNVGPEQLLNIETALTAQIPLGRLGLPEETAEAALFLASSASSFITGIDLCVDGGMAQV